MKKINGIAFLVAAMTAGLAQAQSNTAMEMLNGSSVHIGVTKNYEDLALADNSEKMSIGYDFTTKQNYIFGAYFTPESIDFNGAHGTANAEVKSSVVGLYAGYHFDTLRIRATAGMNFAMNDLTLTDGDDKYEQEETTLGFNVGLEYVTNYNVIIGTRVSTQEVFGTDGLAVSMNIGYKF